MSCTRAEQHVESCGLFLGASMLPGPDSRSSVLAAFPLNFSTAKGSAWATLSTSLGAFLSSSSEFQDSRQGYFYVFNEP